LLFSTITTNWLCELTFSNSFSWFERHMRKRLVSYTSYYCLLIHFESYL